MVEYSIQLSRSNASTPWGFRLQGGADFRSPLVVQRVSAGTVASNAGLHASDVILTINGAPTSSMRHQDAQQSIITSGNLIALRVSRGSSPVPVRAADVKEVTRQTENLSLNTKASANQHAPQSARYQEQRGEHPEYHPYTDPNVQSQSFKTLQGVIASGQDPGSYFQKAPWQSHTVNQVSNEPKKYTPSATWNTVHGTSNGRGVSSASSQAPRSAPYNPSTAAPKPSHGYQPPHHEPTRYEPPPPREPQRRPEPAYHPPNPKPYQAPAHPGYHQNYTDYSPARSAPASSKQIPHGDGVATKGTSAVGQANADPDKTPVCAQCNDDIRGPFVLALNKSWCPNHFTCAKCNSELVNMGFVELNGKIYCENDYETYYASKCAKCKEAIVGDTVNALEKTWHPACFVCAECGGSISSGAFHVENGSPYCMKDWQRLFQTKCCACNFPVEPGDKWIEALDANWHSECFTCATCKVQLEGKPFYPKEGKAYCKDHAKA